MGAMSSGSDAASVGTWKLIKGKVSQTIEDIKASKGTTATASTATVAAAVIAFGQPPPLVATVPAKSGGDFHLTASHYKDLDSEDQDSNVVLQPSLGDDIPIESETKFKQQKQQASPHHHQHQHHHHSRHHYLHLSPSHQQQQHQQHHQEQRTKGADDSESDVENDATLDGDADRSRLRRGLANLKSKVKAHHQQQQLQQQQQQQQQQQLIQSPSDKQSSIAVIKKDTSPNRQPESGSIMRGGFLRKRRKQTTEPVEVPAPAPVPVQSPATNAEDQLKSSLKRKKKGVVSGRKEVEIESGVEMLEDMIPMSSAAAATAANTPADSADGGGGGGKQSDKRRFSLHGGSEAHAMFDESMQFWPGSGSETATNPTESTSNARHSVESLTKTWQQATKSFTKRTVHMIPFVTLALLSLVLYLPMNDFLRGILTCVLTLALVESTWSLLLIFVEKKLLKHMPEKRQFRIPDYSRMPIVEVPAAEEHKMVRAYTGWMNEADSYDPNNYHVSMTRTIFVKLEGTILQLADTTARMPKKVIWNEPPIDRKTLVFSNQRTYNLLGCRIDLLPLGLARKRYFNRKYPIQLIVKNPEMADSTRASIDSGSKDDISAGGATHDHQWSSPQSSATSMMGNNPSIQSDNSSMAQGSHETFDDQRSAASIERHMSADTDAQHTSNIDFASTVLNANLKHLQDTVNPDAELKDVAVPFGDEIRLLLFSRGDREKEDWYRRFMAASTGEVLEQNLRLPNYKVVGDVDMQSAAAMAAILLTNPNYKPKDPKDLKNVPSQNTTGTNGSNEDSAVWILPPDTTSMYSSTSQVNELKTDRRARERDPPIAVPGTSNAYGSSGGGAGAGGGGGGKTQQTPEAETRDDFDEDIDMEMMADDTFEGLLMSANAARNPPDYIRFMTLYQNACRTSKIPVYHKMPKRMAHETSKKRKHRRAAEKHNELWKGIDQSLFLGPSGSVVWFNVLAGRFLYSFLHDQRCLIKVQELLQRKLNSIKLPSFMEDVCITHINLGSDPPLIHRVSTPVLDERGTWVDMDVTYEGLVQATVTTKLNLLRLKQKTRQTAHIQDPVAVGGLMTLNAAAATGGLVPTISFTLDEVQSQSSGLSVADNLSTVNGSNSAIFDSDAESSGDSSSEEESPTTKTAGETGTHNEAHPSPQGNARRIFKIVDRFTASNFFQYATDLPYIQRAMENMNANITLRVDIKGVVGRAVLNIPPPPSDRIWVSFRGPPRLWISAKPAVGDKSFDWSIVTNVIESKLCEEVNKFLVYPNMVDMTIPFLGQQTYGGSNTNLNNPNTNTNINTNTNNNDKQT